MLRFALPLILTLFSASALADADHPEQECASIKKIAAAGDKAYKAGQYEKARDHYTEQAGWSETCQLPDSAIATAYNNVALTWMRQGEYRKARFWLMIDEKDAKSQYNLGLIKDKLAALPPVTSAAGEYWQYAGRGMVSSYVVKAEKQQFNVSFDGVYAGLMAMYYGPNIGSMGGVVSVKDGKALLQVNEDADIHCSAALQFTPEALSSSVEGDCGFGHNVSAAGTYSRVE